MYYIEIYGSFKNLSYTIMIPNEEFGVEYGFFEYWDEETMAMTTIMTEN